MAADLPAIPPAALAGVAVTAHIMYDSVLVAERPVGVLLEIVS